MRWLFLFSLSLSCSLASAAEVGHWVIGSFSHVVNARQEAERLSDVLGVPVQVSPHPHQKLFRLVVKQSLISRESLMQQGHKGWVIYINEMTGVGPSPSSSSIRTRRVDNELTDSGPELSSSSADPALQDQNATTDDKPLYPEIRAGESLLHYCERIPD